jgi:SAM-dependent methyltransferase
MALHDIQVPEVVRPVVTCRICDSETCSDYLYARGYRIVQCSDCGLRFVNPQPSVHELNSFYSDFDHESTWRGAGEEGFDRAIRDVLLNFRSSGSALDIGSSRGNFLMAMTRAGFSVYGVEPSPRNSEFARSVNRIPTFTGTIEQFLAAPPRQTFDVVTMLNVLEHLRDPKTVLLSLRRLMPENGIIAIVVPDARLHATVGQARRRLGFSDPFLMDLRKHPLVGFDPPPHLCSLEPRTIRLLVEQCRFRTLLLKNAPVIFNQDTWKNVAKTALHAFSELAYHLSSRRIVVGYSTLIVGEKLP